MSVCKNCGAELLEGAFFCGECGEKIEADNSEVIIDDEKQETQSQGDAPIGQANNEKRNMIDISQMKEQLIRKSENLQDVPEGAVRSEDDEADVPEAVEITQKIEINSDMMKEDDEQANGPSQEEVKNVRTRLAKDATPGSMSDKIENLSMDEEELEDEEKIPFGEQLSRAMTSIKAMIKERRFDKEDPELTALFAQIRENIKHNRAVQVGLASVVLLSVGITAVACVGGADEPLQKLTLGSYADKEFDSKIQAIETDLKVYHKNLEQMLSTITPENRKAVAMKLKEMESDIERLQKDNMDLKPAGEEQQKKKDKVSKILEHEKRLLLALNDVCSDPQSKNVDAKMRMIMEELDELDLLNPDGVGIAQSLTQMRAMVDKERGGNGSSVAVQQKRVDPFVLAMDAALGQYRQQDRSMEDLVEKADSKHFKYGKHVEQIWSVKAGRQELMKEVQAISFPGGAYEMKQHLINAISISMDCCDMLNKMSNEELTYRERKDLYKEVRSINNNENREYQLFLAAYESYKRAND